MALITDAIISSFEEEIIINTHNEGESLPPTVNLLAQNKWIIEALKALPLICLFLSIPMFLLNKNRNGYGLLLMPTVFIAPIFAASLYEYNAYSTNMDTLINQSLGGAL